MSEEQDKKRNQARNRGKANERAIAKKLEEHGAYRVPYSGAGAEKGDVAVPGLDLLIEAKVYAVQIDVKGEKYIRLNLDWIKKIRDEATEQGYSNAVVVVRGAGQSKYYVLVGMEEYIDVLRGH